MIVSQFIVIILQHLKLKAALYRFEELTLNEMNCKHN